MLDAQRLQHALETARRDLLAARVTLPQGSAGHWEGELASSALSTATAISALSLVQRNQPAADRSPEGASPLKQLIAGGVAWLAERQNADGGFGDTDLSRSNIATTMLVVAALHLAEQAHQHAGLVTRAMAYCDRLGGIPALRRRYGIDKTFVVPILTNAALAGMAPWSEVAPLPFEAAVVPQRFYRFLRLPVVSYAIPALVGIGQAKFFHDPPWNPFAWLVRKLSVGRSLRVLRRMQPNSGGYLEAVPLTSFVVMSLAATGRAKHAVTQHGVQFLQDTVRADGSWPIDTNLATWNTTLSLNALATAGEDVADLDAANPTLNWLLACQYRERHPFTGADPGGWGWSDLSGAVPDADDTPGALLALAHWLASPSCLEEDRQRILEAAARGIRWLLDLQNRDGGWPTFCRGWGKLPFDRSGTDLTAHVLRAFHAWQEHLAEPAFRSAGVKRERLTQATRNGFAFLNHAQCPEGSWVPLWFGNQDRKNEENPIYGTAKVLLAYADTGHAREAEARRGRAWLLAHQNADHGWGGGKPFPVNALRDSESEASADGVVSSVEETALAVEALLACREGAAIEPSLKAGVAWLIDKIERNEHRNCSPIGFYFAKLWYYERLYPLVFTVGAMGRAAHALAAAEDPSPSGAPQPAVSRVV